MLNLLFPLVVAISLVLVLRIAIKMLLGLAMWIIKTAFSIVFYPVKWLCGLLFSWAI